MVIRYQDQCRFKVYDSLELPGKITKIPQKDRINPGYLYAYAVSIEDSGVYIHK